MRERVTVVLIGALMMALVAHGAERIVVEGVLVRVNERIVTISDFTERIRGVYRDAPRRDGQRTGAAGTSAGEAYQYRR